MEAEQQKSWIRRKHSQVRLGYATLFLTTTILAWLLRDEGENWFASVPAFATCEKDDTCFGYSAVLRVTFLLFCFFAIMCISLLGHKSTDTAFFRTRLHEQFWLPKLLIFIALLVIVFFLPNAFFIWFGFASYVGGVLFIIIQILILVEWAYAMNEEWYRDGKLSLILTISAVLYISGIVGSIMLYAMYSKSGCGITDVFVTISLIVGIIYTYISVREDVEKGALLTSGVVFFYSIYVTWSAITSEPNGCGTLGDHTNGAVLVLGIILTLMSTTISTFTAGSTRGTFTMESQDLLEKKTAEDRRPYNFSYFHFVYACAAMYIGMLLTNWNQFQLYHDKFAYDQGWVAVWIKICSVWVLMLLYIWSLIGPLLMPHRDWS